MRDKVALITGGSSGIGLATALLFALKGAKVAIAARNVDKGQTALEQILTLNGEAIFIPCDVTQADQVEIMVSMVLEHFGRLDYAVNNAGDTGIHGKLHEHSEEDFDRSIAINFKSLFLCMKSELTPMLAHKSGAIVNVSSVKGFTGSGTHPLYSATRHAVIGLTKSAALQYAHNGIRINAVCPAAIHTPLLESALDPIFEAPTPEIKVARYGALLPMGRAGTADEAAEAIVWLCSEAASFVTGHALAVDGGSLAKGIP